MSNPAITHELKQLKTRLSKEQARRKCLRGEISSLNKQLSECDKEIASLSDKVAGIEKNTSNPVLTEHAILRYLQRVKGVNLAEIQQEILAPDLIEHIKTIGSGTFERDGYKVVARNGTVVTIEPI